MSRSRSRTYLLVIALLSTVFIIWNTLDEFWRFKTWGNVLLAILFWLLSPYLAALVGLLTKNATCRRGAVVVSVLEMALFLGYALNGPADEPMYLGFVPVLLLFFTVLVFPAFYLLDLLHRVVASFRSKRGRDSREPAMEANEEQKAPEIK